MRNEYYEGVVVSCVMNVSMNCIPEGTVTREQYMRYGGMLLRGRADAQPIGIVEPAEEQLKELIVDQAHELYEGGRQDRCLI